MLEHVSPISCGKSLILNGIALRCGDFSASLVMRAVPLRMNRCAGSAGFISSGLGVDPLLLLSLALWPFLLWARHNTKALTRCQGHVPGLCSLHIHEPNKPVLYKLSSLGYHVAGVENGLRQNLSHGRVFIFLDLTLHLHVYLLLTATHAPCLSTRLLAVLAACKLCPSVPALVLLLPLPGTCSVQTVTPRIASVILTKSHCSLDQLPKAHCPSLSSNFPLPQCPY